MEHKGRKINFNINVLFIFQLKKAGGESSVPTQPKYLFSQQFEPEIVSPKCRCENHSATDMVIFISASYAYPINVLLIQYRYSWISEYNMQY